MPKRRLSAKEVLRDIRAGMDDAGLMEKYRLAPEGLQSVFRKLVEAGAISQSQLDQRRLEAEKTAHAVQDVPFEGGGPPTATPGESLQGRAPLKAVDEEPDTASATVQLYGADADTKVESTGGLLSFLSYHKVMVAWGVAIAILLAMGLSAWFWMETTVEDTVFTPMKREIARATKQIEMRLTFLEHKEASKAFVKRVADLEVELKGKHPELVAKLNEASRALGNAERKWADRIGEAGFSRTKNEEDLQRHWKIFSRASREALLIMDDPAKYRTMKQAALKAKQRRIRLAASQHQAGRLRIMLDTKNSMRSLLLSELLSHAVRGKILK